MTRAAAAVVGVAIALLAACDESPTRPSDLEGSTWRLLSLERAGAAPAVIGDPSRYTIRFSENSRVNLRSDCNTCAGSYSLTGSSVSFGALACTRAFCGSASLDDAYTRALQSARFLARSGDALIVQGDGVTLRFGL